MRKLLPLLLLIIVSLLIYGTITIHRNPKNEIKHPIGSLIQDKSSPSEHPKTSTPLEEFKPNQSNLLVDPAKTDLAKTTEPEVSVDTHPFTVLIRDHAGQEIPYGQIRFPQLSYEFRDGFFQSNSIPSGISSIIAEATGYQSASALINYPTRADYEIVLDYRFDFQLTVTDSDGRPLRDLDVNLWEGLKPLRPIPDRFTVQYVSKKSLQETCTLGITNNQIFVETARSPLPQDFESANLLIPHDRIVGFFDTMITNNTGCQASLLRAWDSLYFYSQITEQRPTKDDYLTFQRENALQKVYFPTLASSIKKSDALFTIKTDERGQCTFHDLPAGLYYYQAMGPISRSRIFPILPVQTSTTISVRNNAKLMLFVKRKGNLPSILSNLADASITVKSIGDQNSSLYMQKTSIYGMALFEDLAFGDYSITVTDSGGTVLSSETFTVDSPMMSHTFWLEDTGYTVSGRIIDETSGQPVRNYPMELHYQIRTVIQTCSSDTSGFFEFTDVPPGKYSVHCSSLSSDILSDTLEYTQSPYQLKRLLAEKFEQKPLDPQELKKTPFMPIRRQPNWIRAEVVDRDVENLEVLVVPYTRTRFQGTVRDLEGKPVAGAILLLDNGNWRTIEPQAKTDENGAFDVSFVALPIGYSQSVSVKAVLNQDSSNSESTPDFQYTETLNPLAFAEKEIPFTCGETKANIDFVLENVQPKFTLQIELLTPEGIQYTAASVYARKNSRFYSSTVNSEGKFQFRFFDPGRVSLEIMPFADEPGGKIPYCNENQSVLIPEDQSDMSQTYPLKPAGYIKGLLLDYSGDASTGIVAKSQFSTQVSSIAEDGRFSITGIPIGIEHDILLYQNREFSAPLITGLKPNIDNLIVQKK